MDNPKALGSFLRDSFVFLRRTKKDVGQEMPKINNIIEYVEYNRRDIENAESILQELASTVLSDKASFAERGNAARELDIRLRYLTGISKARYVAEYVKIFLENDTPIILTGWHHDVYDMWEDVLKDYNPQFYTGRETPKQKVKAKDNFVNGESNLLILSNRSGAGIDGLQYRCSTIIHGELDFSPEVHKQLIGRLDREGQEEPVTSIYLVSNGGSDPAMIDLLGLKSSQSKSIIDPHIGVEKRYSDKGRIIELAKKYLESKSS